MKRDLVLACRILAGEGQADNIYGHVSARLPNADILWMKGAGVGLVEVRERAAEIQLRAQPTVDTKVSHTAEDEAVRKRAMWYPGAIRAAFEYLARRHGTTDLL